MKRTMSISVSAREVNGNSNPVSGKQSSIPGAMSLGSKRSHKVNPAGISNGMHESPAVGAKWVRSSGSLSPFPARKIIQNLNSIQINLVDAIILVIW